MGLERVVFFVLLLIAVGCAGPTNSNLPQHNEVVMSPGMSITAENLHGKLTITADDELKRSFTWANDTRSVIMWPRKKRWYGSLGLYFPGSGTHWMEHDGITRGVIDEGVLDFKSQDALIEYINKYSDKESLVYNDKGLCVFWKKNPGAGGTLIVMVWQFLINNEPPKRIPGSQNSKISVAYKHSGKKGKNRGHP